LKRSFLEASKYVIIAPIINADSNPSLNIIEKEDEKAIPGAIVPIPETNLSDSSNPC
jgi:hypothetical protein